jgi:lysophospholipase L1-like esterase
MIQSALPPPEPSLWHAPIVEDKVEYFRNYAAGNDIDVLFIGNSTTQAGVDPAAFDAARSALGVQGDSFNASVEGLPPSVNKEFLKMYLRYADPHTVVIGLTPQDLNSNSPWAKDMDDRAGHSINLQAGARDTLMGDVLAFLVDNSALFRYRYVLHQLLLRGGNPVPHPDVYFDERGFHAIARSLTDFTPSERFQAQNRAGVMNYSAAGEQADSVREMITTIRSHGAEPILVNLPLSDHYYANFDHPEVYQDYQNALQALADELQVPLWDMEALAGGEQFVDAEFGDLNHLNAVGAERLSALLAQDFATLVGSQNSQVTEQSASDQGSNP